MVLIAKSGSRAVSYSLPNPCGNITMVVYMYPLSWPESSMQDRIPQRVMVSTWKFGTKTWLTWLGTWSAVNKKTQWAKIYIKKLFSYSQLQGDRYSQSYRVCTHDYRYYLVNKVVYSYFCNSDRIDLFVDDCTMT